jgi:hypothetical protein
MIGEITSGLTGVTVTRGGGGGLVGVAVGEAVAAGSGVVADWATGALPRSQAENKPKSNTSKRIMMGKRVVNDG